jgi:hypothetical protein
MDKNILDMCQNGFLVQNEIKINNYENWDET